MTAPTHLSDVDMTAGDDEELEETEELEGSEEESNEENDYTPPTKEEWSKLQRQLKRANNQAAKLKAASKETPAVSDDDIEAVKAEVRTEVENKYKARIVNAEAKSQLVKMGLKGEPARLLKLLDLSEIDVEDDSIDGLEDQLDALKDDYPDLFTAPKIRSSKHTAGDAPNKETAKVPETSAEKLARMMRTGATS